MRQRCALALIGFLATLVSSCGNGTSNPTGSSSALATPTNSASPSYGPIACISAPGRLPVILSLQGGGAGWVTFPTGAFSTDAAATEMAAAMRRSDGRVMSSVSYDATAHKWQPYSPSQVSPDGTRYAYVLTGYEQTAPQSYSLHIALLDGSGDRNLSGTRRLTGNWFLLAWTDAGILVSERITTNYPQTMNTLYLFDPATGTSAVLDQSQDRAWTSFDHGLVWGVGRLPGDPPALFPQSGNADRLLVFDMHSKDITTRYYDPQSLMLGPMAFDQTGHPVFSTFIRTSGSAGPTDQDVYFLAAADTRKLLETDSLYAPNGNPAPSHGLADGTGIWLGSSQGIVRYFDGSSMRQVITLNTRTVDIVGGCVPEP